MSDSIDKVTFGIFETPANAPLIARLRARGDEFHTLPPLLITRAAFVSAFDAAQFDWLIFTDVFSVGAFTEALREAGTDLFDLDGMTIFANGEAVADRLRFEQLHADLIPLKTNDDEILEAIRQFLGGELAGVRFLVIGGGNELPEFARQLSMSGGDVSFLKVFEAEFTASTAQARALLTGGAMDQVILTSPEDLVALAALAGGQSLAEFLQGASIAVTSEDVFQSARENALRPLFFKDLND